MPSQEKVPVNVWAKQYETRRAIAGADIIDVVTGERWKTGKDGYAHLMVEPGRTLTLAFNKAGYPDIQTSTVTAPPEGLTSRENEITFQVVNRFLEKVLLAAFGRPPEGMHYISSTVSAKGKDLHDDRGEKDVTVTLRSKDGSINRTDGIYPSHLLGKTEWLRPVLTNRFKIFSKYRQHSTSLDGGVIFKNVPPGEYILEAKKTGADGKSVILHNAEVTVYKNSPLGINASPPHGPKVF